LLPTTRAVVALGSFAWAAALRGLRENGVEVPSPLPRFGHGVEVGLPGDLTLLGCFHVSQQNTFTGRLTEAMLDDVLARAVGFARTG
jgi:uracil-DNA glycosylase